jgi:hypothetical protein
VKEYGIDYIDHISLHTGHNYCSFFYFMIENNDLLFVVMMQYLPFTGDATSSAPPQPAYMAIKSDANLEDLYT